MFRGEEERTTRGTDDDEGEYDEEYAHNKTEEEEQETKKGRQPFVDHALCMKTKDRLGIGIAVIRVMSDLSCPLLCSLFFKMVLEPELEHPCQGRRESSQ